MMAMAEHDPAGFDPAGRTVAWSAFYAEARERLSSSLFESCDVDARRLVEEASGYEGADFHLGLKEPATKRGVARFDAMIERRLRGEPLQYVIGSWGFRTLDLLVDRRVLIPRPETEVVAGVALDELERLAEPGCQLTAVDLGTGSGAIGLSLAVERTDTDVVLTDVSPEALQVARANLAGTGRAATRVTIAQGSWFEPLAAELRGKLDLIVSNPPYVAPDDHLPPEVRDWEPMSALMAHDRGRSHLEVLLAGAGAWLRGGGAVVLEMSPEQTSWATERATDAGFVDVKIVADMAGRDRALRGRWPS
jgi:release factor glutamine methyltransferase